MTARFNRRGFLGAGGAAASLLFGVRSQRAAAARQASVLRPDPKHVIDLREGFSYRIVAKRKDVNSQRLAHVDVAPIPAPPEMPKIALPPV